jgi:hypothetical protein
LIAQTVAHRFSNEHRSSYRLGQALNARGDVHRIPNCRKLEPLKRADAADDGWPGMNADADPQRLATSSGQIAIERVYGEQDFPAGGHGVLGMIRFRLARTTCQCVSNTMLVRLNGRTENDPPKINTRKIWIDEKHVVA